MSDARRATRPLPPGVTATPVWGTALRADGGYQHRFALTWRHEGRKGPLNLLVGMNPSGAAEDVADSTLIVVSEYARRWNDGDFSIVNVCPFRSTSPKGMEFDIDVQSANLNYVRRIAHLALGTGGHVALAWGSPSVPAAKLSQFRWYARQTFEALFGIGAKPLCLGRTADGSPHHPTRLSYDTQLEPWSPR